MHGGGLPCFELDMRAALRLKNTKKERREKKRNIGRKHFSAAQKSSSQNRSKTICSRLGLWTRVCTRVPLCLWWEQLYRGCEWNKVLVATAGEEVITLNVGHLGDAQGLIISLNASGFPMFSPYTHRWPMTHQPLSPHSKPLLHYLNREASCRKVGGQTPGPASFIISPPSSKPGINHSLARVHLAKFWTY